MALPANNPLSPPSRRRLWAWRWFFALGLPVMLIALVELAMQLAGSGFDTAFWVPGSEPGTVRSNDEFARQFSSKKVVTRPFYTQIQARKPAGTVRIFLLGESAAMGTPDPAFGPARLLEVMLQQQYPGKSIEVINAAMRGIDSFVVRKIARDCARYEPDLFIVYTGNNECIGMHAPSAGTPEVALWRPLLLASDWCKGTAVGQFIRRNFAAGSPPAPQDMEFFRRQRRLPDDPLIELVRENFQANLRAVCQLDGFPKILATAPVNLRGCPPLASLHRPGLGAAEQGMWQEAFDKGVAEEQARRYASAIVNYQTAAALDSQHAELRYRLGRCFLAAGNAEQARGHFSAARDWDALLFRADQRLNHALRTLAVEFKSDGASLCDLEENFMGQTRSPGGIPGEEFFYEHVHPTFDGVHLIARGLCQRTSQVLAAKLGPPANLPLPTAAECARELAFTRLDEYNVAQAMARLRSGPPFLDQADHAVIQARFEQQVSALRQLLTLAEVNRALALYEEALRRRPQDWALRFNLGNAYLQLGRSTDALTLFNWLVTAHPHQASFQKAYGQALLAIGQKEEACNRFTAALKLSPHDDELRNLARQMTGH